MVTNRTTRDRVFVLNVYTSTYFTTSPYSKNKKRGYMPHNNKDTKPIITLDNRLRRRDIIPTALALDCVAHRGLGFEPSLCP